MPGPRDTKKASSLIPDDMLLTDFDYHLPPELIAQQALPERDASRMLVVDRREQTWSDDVFLSLPQYLRAGDVVVLNNTRVFPARLKGFRKREEGRGGHVEILLLREASEDGRDWEVLGKPGRAFKEGSELVFGDGRLIGVVTHRGDHGRCHIRFETSEAFSSLVDEIGNTPLPPYIDRDRELQIREPRYQTLYASKRGAIAAPTAGLHFTDRVLKALKEAGVIIVEITHHVGYATFQPIREEIIEAHHIERETYDIPDEVATVINSAKAAGGRLIAVGTTTVRALESSVAKDGTIVAQKSTTELFIYPGYRFRAIDGLLTNFHLPQSSLLVLVAAFAGLRLILDAYQHAVAERYRFFSYGDCMLMI